MLAWIAAGAQKRLTMQECIDMAVKNNYGIRAAEGEVEKSQLMQGAAWDLDKTSLSLKQDPTSGGSPDNSLTLSQSFDFPHGLCAAAQEFESRNRSGEKSCRFESQAAVGGGGKCLRSNGVCH